MQIRKVCFTANQILTQRQITEKNLWI